MRNITVTVPDDVYRDAKVRAAERGRPVSALVADHLRELSARDAESTRLEALQHRVQGEITSFRAGDRLERDQAHGRALR